MSHIIIPQRRIWTRQPQRPVRLDSSYLRDGAVGACFSGSPSDAFGNAIATPSQGVAIRQMVPGSSYGYFPTDSYSSYSANLGKVSLSGEYTLAFQLSGLYYGSDHAILIAGQSGVGGLYVSFTGGYNGSGLSTPTVSVTHFTVADYTLGSLGIKPAEKLCTIVITGKANSEAVLYCNGSRIASVAIGGLVAYSGQASYGALGGNNFRGGSSFALASPIALTAKEAIDLTINPWKLFEQRSRSVFVGAGSSNTYTLSPGGSFTFSGSSSVIKTKQYSPSGSVTFSGTAAELKTKIQVPSGNITYSGTASLTLTNGSTEYTITPSGTITFSGTTDYVKERVIYPTGSITYNGSALELKIRSFVPTGNITFSGNNTEYRTKILAPTGLITFQGSAPITGPGGETGATMTKLPMTGAGK